MRPDPRELRRLPWLPPLRLQLRLSPPPPTLSADLRPDIARARARQRGTVGMLAAVAIASLVAGSSPTGAAADPSTAAAESAALTGLNLGMSGQGARVSVPYAMVPDNAGKGRGTLPDAPPATTPTGPAVPVSGVTDLGIPEVALAAYRSAAASMAEADPDCRIGWTVIAGIGRVETDHGQYGGRAPAADGSVLPPILGIPLDGRPGVALIRDTDGGRLDSDTTYDRAVGPMQFIPGTWAAFPDADGNGDGIADPHNLFDASLATASYLCSGVGDLSTVEGQRSAVFRYNHSDSYVDLVLYYAAAYAQGIHPTGPPPQPAGPPPVVPSAPVTEPAHPSPPPATTAPTPRRTTTPPTTAPPTTAPPTTTPPTTTPPTTTPPTTTPTGGPPTTESTSAPPSTAPTAPTGTTRRTRPGGSTTSTGATGSTNSTSSPTATTPGSAATTPASAATTTPPAPSTPPSTP